MWALALLRFRDDPKAAAEASQELTRFLESKHKGQAGIVGAPKTGSGSPGRVFPRQLPLSLRILVGVGAGPLLPVGVPLAGRPRCSRDTTAHTHPGEAAFEPTQCPQAAYG